MSITGVPPFFAVMPRRKPSYHVAVDRNTPSFYYLRPCHGVCHQSRAPVTSPSSDRRASSPKFTATARGLYKLTAPLAPPCIQAANAPTRTSNPPPESSNFGFSPKHSRTPLGLASPRLAYSRLIQAPRSFVLASLSSPQAPRPL